MTTPSPSLSTRLGDVRSSPVRDIRLSFTTHAAAEIAADLTRHGNARAAA